MGIYLVKSCILKVILIKLAGTYQLTRLSLHILYDPLTFVSNVPPRLESRGSALACDAYIQRTGPSNNTWMSDNQCDAAYEKINQHLRMSS